ncbi:hypothetical protein RZN22_16160, partial [Bacillaceae bacterium S4-13-58]
FIVGYGLHRRDESINRRVILVSNPKKVIIEEMKHISEGIKARNSNNNPDEPHFLERQRRKW